MNRINKLKYNGKKCKRIFQIWHIHIYNVQTKIGFDENLGYFSMELKSIKNQS